MPLARDGSACSPRRAKWCGLLDSLDFKLNDDGAILVRPLKRSALFIVGLLKRPGRVAMTVGQMNQAVTDAAVDRQQRSRELKSRAS